MLSDLFTDQSRDNDGNVKPMLLVMAKMGMGRDHIGVMLDFALGDQLSREHKAYFHGAIVQHSSPWAEQTPQWLFSQITIDRLERIFEERGRGEVGWQISPSEITTLLYPATLDAPLKTEYADIYLWASAKAAAAHYNKSEDEIWSAIGSYRVLDSDVLTPQGRYFYTYQELCRDARRKIVQTGLKHIKTRQTDNHHKERPKGIQLDLF